MSYQLTVIYHHPTDPAAFDEHYDSTHAPLASKIPGLRSYTSQKAGQGPEGDPAERAKGRKLAAALRAQRAARTPVDIAVGHNPQLAKSLACASAIGAASSGNPRPVASSSARSSARR